MNTVICTVEEQCFSRFFPDVDPYQPYLCCGIVILQEEAVIASAILYDNPEIDYQGSPVLLIGHFAANNDLTAAGALFEAAEKSATNRGKKYLIGPMNGTVWNDYRLPLSKGGPFFTGDLVQPLYYADLFSRMGFAAIHRYHSYISPIGSEAEIAPFIPENITVRNLNINNFEQELAALHELCNLAFRSNPFFQQIAQDTFIEKYRQWQPFLDERLILIATQQQVPVAFIFAYADPRAKTSLILKTIAKHPEYQLPGLMSNMARILFRKARELGFTKTIHAFMHEENRSMVRSREFGGTIFCSYALFGKQSGL